jgi:hypothetical protein
MLSSVAAKVLRITVFVTNCMNLAALTPFETEILFNITPTTLYLSKQRA